MASYPPPYFPDEPIGQPVEHPHATTVLLLGALSIFCCGALGPVAWVMGKRALDQIEYSGGAYGGRTQVMVGYILGIVGTILMVLMATLFLLLLIGGSG
ncbi:DUF4190 domain-containing protein [Nocardia sp. CDC159]|uniref:DUF4190 domain-containing protein n=1 Tax=Nocardia pulmonis TaxID=2951408 RepID=A0A9X2E233_9NOCA|nr:MULTISPECIES: DUF4190 domain-containing protein [Nocardia]MCM6772829.1 DUF4190 domain-containing protein [Nocardia pulmonis]MCM6785868.1 DUF4190 domain-containing protein [Nocardia sp. CDC159]